MHKQLLCATRPHSAPAQRAALSTLLWDTRDMGRTKQPRTTAEKQIKGAGRKARLLFITTGKAAFKIKPLKTNKPNLFKIKLRVHSASAGTQRDPLSTKSSPNPLVSWEIPSSTQLAQPDPTALVPLWEKEGQAQLLPSSGLGEGHKVISSNPGKSPSSLQGQAQQP